MTSDKWISVSGKESQLLIQTAQGVTAWFGHAPLARPRACGDCSLPSSQPKTLGESPPSQSGQTLMLPMPLLTSRD